MRFKDLTVFAWKFHKEKLALNEYIWYLELKAQKEINTQTFNLFSRINRKVTLSSPLNTPLVGRPVRRQGQEVSLVSSS